MRLLGFLCLHWVAVCAAVDSTVVSFPTDEAQLDVAFPTETAYSLKIRHFHGTLRLRGTSGNQLRVRGKVRSKTPHSIRLEVKGDRAEIFPSDPEADGPLDVLSDEPVNLNDTAVIPVYDPLRVDLEFELPERYIRNLRLDVSAAVFLESLALPGGALVVVETTQKSAIHLDKVRFPRGTVVLIADDGNVEITESEFEKAYASSACGTVHARGVRGDVELYSERGTCAGEQIMGSQSGSGLLLVLERDARQGEVLSATTKKNRQCALSLLTLPFLWDLFN